MDSNDKILKATAEATGVDSYQAMVKVYMRLKKEVVHELENKRQKLRLEVAEMKVKVMERKGELNLLDERIRHADEYVEFRRQHQAQLVRAIEVEMARRNTIKKCYDEVINRMQEKWKENLEIYNRFPLAQRKATLEKEVKLRKFQLKVETQRKENTTHIFENIVHTKKLIHESRVRKMEALRATKEKDKITAAELLTIKQAKIKLLARLKAEKDAKEREKQQLREVKSSVPSGSSFPWGTPSTPMPLSHQTYGLAPAPSQSSQGPRSQVFQPSSQNTVLMSFNRTIIEERCVVVVPPRPAPDSTTATSSDPAVNCSTRVQGNSTVSGQELSFEEPMEVETERSLVDLDYGGSDSSQSSSKNLFSRDTRAAESSQHVIVHPTESVPGHLPHFTARTSSTAISFGTMQSQTTISHQVERGASSTLCTNDTAGPALSSAFTKPAIGTSSSRCNFLTPTTKASLAYVMPLPQMTSVSAASSTLCPKQQNLCREPRLTHQNAASPAGSSCPTLQNAALRSPSPIQQHETTAAPRQTLQTVTSPAAAPRLTHQNVTSPVAASHLTYQGVALQSPSPIHKLGSTAAPHLAHEDVAFPIAAPQPTLQNAALQAPAPIQIHKTAASTRPSHQNSTSPVAALRPTHQNVALRASSPIQQKGTTAATRLTHQTAALPAAASLPSGPSAPPRSLTIANKTAVPMRELHVSGTSEASLLTTPGSQNAAPNRCTPKSQHPRFYPYMSPRNATSGKLHNSVTHSASQLATGVQSVSQPASSVQSVSQPAPSVQSVSQSAPSVQSVSQLAPSVQTVSQPAPGVRASVARNPTVDDRSVFSPPVVPGRNVATIPALGGLTLPTKTQPNVVTQKSSSPVMMTIATQKTAATRPQVAVNEVRKPKDHSSEGEKSHYFNQKATEIGTQQGAILDPEQECHEDFDQVQECEANSDQGCRSSEGGQEFNIQGYDCFDMDDVMTSPPFSKDDVDITPPRIFTSPPLDLGTHETGSAVGGAGANFGFSSLFGNPFGANVAANGNDSSQAAPFSLLPAQTTNIFRLF